MANKNNKDLLKEWVDVFDIISDPIFIQDKDFNVIKANKALATALGMRLKDVAKSKCYSLIHRTSKPWRGCLFKKIKKGDRSYEEEVFLPGAGITLLITVVPISDSKGRLIGSIHITKDISERKRITDALRESELRYKAIYEASRDAIMILVPGKRFINANPATVKLFGCKNEKEFCSKTPADLSPELQPDGTLSSLKADKMTAKAMKKGAHFFEWTHKKVDGKVFFAEVVLVKMLLKGEHVLHATVRDVTRHKIADEKLKKQKAMLAEQTWGLKKTNEGIKLLYKELEEKNRRLEKLDELKTQFLSTVSHELRTPLTITKEGINLILDRIPGDINKKQEEVLNMSRNNIDRLTRIINDLLDISKIESGKMELSKQPVDLNKIVNDTASFFAPAAEKKHIYIKVDMPGKGLKVSADADKLAQVFTNLVGNAMKFTERGGITISAKVKDNRIECAVSDTGPGIAEKDLNSAFDKFQQLGSTAMNKEKGTGLGLSIAKSIVEMHNGSMWAESKTGRGTRIVFVLPK